MLPSWLDRAQQGALLLLILLFSAGYATVGVFMLLLTVIAEGITLRRLPWSRSGIDGFIVAFLSVFLLSGWFSPYRPTALGSLGLAALTIYLGYGPLSRQLRRHPWFLSALIGAWIAGGMAAAIWALYLQRASGLPAFTPALGQNAVGTTMLIAFLLAVGVFMSASSARRLAAGSAAVVTAAALAVSYTRGAWLGALVGVAVLLIPAGRRAWPRVFLVLAATVVIVVALAGSERGPLIQRIVSIPSLTVNRDRVALMRVGVQIVSDYPLLGTGMNTFSVVYPRYKRPDDFAIVPPSAHNVYLNMAAEGGIGAAFVFLAIVIVGIASGWRWVRRTGANRTAAASIVHAAFTGVAINQLFDGTMISVHLGVGLWILLAILVEAPAKPTSEWGRPGKTVTTTAPGRA